MNKTFDYLQQHLSDIYTPNEIRQLGNRILEDLLGCNRTFLLLHRQETLPQEIYQKVEDITNRLKKNEPLEYILGKAFFRGMELEVNTSTLIPRPETEELVEWIIERQKRNEKWNILDIGTGSGCIALALSMEKPEWVVTGWDISPLTIETAKKNAKKNLLNTHFEQQDIFKPKTGERQWEMIVSNPPYICMNEKAEMENLVLEYEPHTALFVPDENPLLFYRTIAQFGKEKLVENGELYFEINPLYAKELKEMLSDLRYKNIEIKNDMFGKQRFVFAQK